MFFAGWNVGHIVADAIVSQSRQLRDKKTVDNDHPIGKECECICIKYASLDNGGVSAILYTVR